MYFNFPNIDPVLIHIGPLQIRWYALTYIAGITIGIQYIKWLNKIFSLKISNKILENIVLWLVLGIVIGGRLGYVFFYHSEYYLSNPIEIFKTWQGGMSFHGGLAGVTLAMYLFCRRYKLNYLNMCDLLASAAGIGIFFGRIANFINGELYGRITNVPWAVIFPHVGLEPRHPSQLYEALCEGLVIFMAINYFIFRHKILEHSGKAFGLFLTLYGIFRVVIELTRQPDYQIGLLLNYLTLGQILSAPLIIIGYYLLCIRKTKS